MNHTPEQLREGAQEVLKKATVGGDPVGRATLKAKEAAHYLGISYWKLLELLKAGKGPAHIKAGNRLLFRRETLDDWLSQQEAASTVEPEPISKIRRLK